MTQESLMVLLGDLYIQANLLDLLLLIYELVRRWNALRGIIWCLALLESDLQPPHESQERFPQ